MTLPQLIRSGRAQVKMTQQELADAVGTSRMTIISIEKNAGYQPGFYLVLAMLHVLREKGAQSMNLMDLSLPPSPHEERMKKQTA